MKRLALKSIATLPAIIIGISLSLAWTPAQSFAEATQTPTDCGCSGRMSVEVHCLVSVVEATLDRKLISKPQPRYPEQAKAAHISGDVSVGVIIDVTGKVIFAWLEKGNAALSSAALDAAYQLRVKPTLLSGRPVNVKSVVTYRFRLPRRSSV